MMLGGVGINSTACLLIWTKGNVNVAQYMRMLVHHVFPTLKSTYGVRNCNWTQGGAPAHTSDTIQKYLESKVGSNGFWSMDVWPPNLPNLNPLDFYV